MIAATPGKTPDLSPATPAVLELVWTASVVGPAPTANAPAVYVIEAGTEPGASNVAAVETEGAEVTYSTPIANGIYYVRLKAKNACGTSQPSPEVAVRVTGSVAGGKPNPLVLLKTVRVLRDRLGATTFIRVTGQVRNGWRASPASFIEVTTTYEGPGGEALGTSSTYVNGGSRRLKVSRIVTDTALEPTATGCFLTFADFPTARVASAKVEVTSADNYGTEPLRGRVRVEGALLQQGGAFGDLTVSGRMKNTGDRPTYLTEIWMEAKDAEGKVVDCDAASVNGPRVVSDGGITTQAGLYPGEVGVFENFTEAVADSVEKLRHWINWDETDRRPPASPTARYRMLRERLATVLAEDERASSPAERMELRDALRREVRLIEQRLSVR